MKQSQRKWIANFIWGIEVLFKREEPPYVPDTAGLPEQILVNVEPQ